MLKSMRKNLKSLAPILWFVVIAFIISIFAVWGGSGRLGEGKGMDVLATVGRDKISVDLYYDTIRQRIESLKEQYKELDAGFIQQLNIPLQTLEQLIQRSLIRQKADQLGIKASDSEVREKIISYPVFQQDGKFVGFEKYEQILNWNRISVVDFENALKEEIIMEKVIKAVTVGAVATEEEVWENYKNRTESVRMEYLILESENMTVEAQPGDEEIRQYFESKKNDYKVLEKREGLYVFFKTDDLKDLVAFTDKEIENYYKENLSQFREPEQIRVSRIFLTLTGQEREAVRTQGDQILERAKRGEDFGELALVYSMDDKAENRGDWGLYDWRSLSSEEQDVIQKMEKDEVSSLMEMDEGMSILKVTDRVPEVTRSMDEVRERIVSILTEQKGRQMAEDRVSKLEKAARKSKDLKSTAQELGYSAQATGLLADGDSLDDIDPSGSFSRNLFGLEMDDVSSPIYTYRGVGVIQLKKIEDPRPAAFEDVKEQVKEEVLKEKQKEKAFKRMKQARREFQSGDVERVAEKYELEVKTSEEHIRGQYLYVIGENSEVDRLAFTIPLNQVSEPIAFESGYALIKILARKIVGLDDFKLIVNEETEKYIEEKKNKFFQSYLVELREKKGVKIKYNLFQKINADILSSFSGEE